jgi:acyl-CoA hydrolase
MSQTDRRRIRVSELMPPEKANFSGNIHGGHIMEICDRVAYACAARYASSYVVTLSVDQILFKQPIHVGELVNFEATINYVGKTSMEVGIKVTAENLMTGESRHTNSCYFTMVAVDEALKPKKVPELECHTALEKQRYQAAIARKEIRLKFKEEHETCKKSLRDQFK